LEAFVCPFYKKCSIGKCCKGYFARGHHLMDHLVSKHPNEALTAKLLETNRSKYDIHVKFHKRSQKHYCTLCNHFTHKLIRVVRDHVKREHQPHREKDLSPKKKKRKKIR